MGVFFIDHRWSSRPIAVVEAESYQRAVELAAGRGVRLLYAKLRNQDLLGASLPAADLRGADLGKAWLDEADLRGADLRSAVICGASLRGARLRGADLREADLRGTDLRLADLRESRLVGADLRGVSLLGAQLGGSVLDWRWSAIPLELLRRQAGSPQAQRLLTDLAFQDDARPFGWIENLLRHPAEAEWALEVLRGHLRRGDNAPEWLRRVAADASSTDPQEKPAVARAVGDVPVPSAPLAPPAAPAVAQVVWSRRGSQRKTRIVRDSS
jgi:hypothetical protein